MPTPVPMVAKADAAMTANAGQVEDAYDAKVKLFGVIPIATAKVQVADDDYVIAGGFPFGIKIFAEGVLIVGFNDVKTANGLVNPATDAGLQAGDFVLAVEKKPISTNTQLQEQLEASGGNPVTLSVQRQGKNHTVTLTPALAEDGKYKAGMWVRDSTAGLGTMTFYQPASGMYGGLGHAVCDSDTGEIMSVLTGEIVKAEISGIHKATAGTAGEIRGTLLDQVKMGSILQNCQCGIYGELYDTLPQGELIKVARKQEVKTGAASIVSYIEGERRTYACEIEKINLNEDTTQNLVIRITDEALLAATGGIVQGMSGSPILQNGMLIGAVTHVFVNSPQKGYGVFADTMLTTVRQTKREIRQKVG